MLLVIGLSGVASIEETQRIHEQILSVEDNYRHIETLVEGVRADTSRVAVLRQDRLLDPNGSGTDYSGQLAKVRANAEADFSQLRALRLQQENRAPERLESAVRIYLDGVAAEFRETPVRGDKLGSINDRFRSQSRKVFAVTEELTRMNEETFESRRQALNHSVESLQNDIWETILTALILGTVIAGASIFRISGLEKESARQQQATRQAETSLRHLSQQLVSSQEQERKALSRELHDEIGQLLTALRMELGHLERARGTGADFTSHLEQAKKLAESTLRSTRDIAMGLRPAMLDVLGLGPALEWQTREFSRRYNTPIQLEVDGDLKDLSDRHRTYLYRIVQEGLTNCARHAQAKSIRVRLEDGEGRLAVTVEDDGVGFDQHGSVVSGLGLLGMAERVRELCGSMAIDSEPGKGTRISVILPLARDTNTGEITGREPAD